MVFTLAVIFYRFLFLLLVLEPVIIALPWLSRRDMTWGDSPGQTIIDIGAAGFGALNQLWDQFTTLPPAETKDLPDPSQPLLLPEAPNTPEWLTPPFFDPNLMKKCSAYSQPIGAPDDQLPGEGGILTLNEELTMIPEKEEYEGIYVQQSTKTG